MSPSRTRTSRRSGRSWSASLTSTSAARLPAARRLRRSGPRRSRRWRQLRAALDTAVGRPSRPIRSTASSTPAVRACAISYATVAGDSAALPDVVVRPADEDAGGRGHARRPGRRRGGHRRSVAGTNISGSLEAPAKEQRTVVSLDLGLRGARRSTMRPGWPASKPACSARTLEEQLNARGWTPGHFPDSFTHSTLGGWIATRSSGMQSDRYGDIADLTRAVRVVTPAGTAGDPSGAHTSTGPSVREMVLGSEGRLGVITEATIHVRRVPERRVILGYLFPTGPRPRRDAGHRGERGRASVTRVSDANETASRSRPGRLPTLSTAQVQGAHHLPGAPARLRHRRDVPVLHRLRGNAAPRRRPAQGRGADRRPARRAQHRRVPGELYDQKKFDTPYIRDFLLDRGTLGDVSETAAPWSHCPASTTPSSLPPTAASTSWACAATSCATCRTPTTRVRACTSRSRSRPRSRATSHSSSTTASSPRSSRRSSIRARTLSHHHAVGTEHAAGSRRTSPRRVSRCCRRCSTVWIPERT